MVSSDYSIVTSDDAMSVVRYNNLLARVIELEARQEERDKAHNAVAASVEQGSFILKPMKEKTQNHWINLPGGRYSRDLIDVGGDNDERQVSQCTAFVRTLMLQVERLEEQLAQMSEKHEALQQSFKAQEQQLEELKASKGNENPTREIPVRSIDSLNVKSIDKRVCMLVDNRMAKWREEVLAEVAAMIRKSQLTDKERGGERRMNDSDRNYAGRQGGGGGVGITAYPLSSVGESAEGGDSNTIASTNSSGRGSPRSDEGVGPLGRVLEPLVHPRLPPFPKPSQFSRPSQDPQLPPVNGCGSVTSPPVGGILLSTLHKTSQRGSVGSLSSVNGGGAPGISVSFSSQLSTARPQLQRSSQRNIPQGRRGQRKSDLSRSAVLESDAVVVEEDENNDKSLCNILGDYVGQPNTTATIKENRLPSLGAGRRKKQRCLPKPLDGELLIRAQAEILKMHMRRMAEELAAEEEEEEEEEKKQKKGQERGSGKGSNLQ
ncbi:hypothetical protein LSM04_004822 [Trypanosoma melophagium]|uniref:uncharacterized protein n=1 Tax=Trypanosoma melophagium TaxID=715481 RepID=UPI00351A71B4|nr:hypothetical protein LSM04_004822 [Trypanosoma melophagium]